MRIKTRRVAALAGLLLLTGTVAACGGNSNSGDASGGAGAAGTAEASAAAGDSEAASGDPIVVGSILDVSGLQNVSGTAMYNSLKLAVKQWNEEGGLLGRPVEIKFYDSESDQAKYTQYATEMSTAEDKPDVAMAGINSASREAIRPIFNKNGVLYFYNELYEGGVCDKNTFATGVVPSQSLAALIPAEIAKYGKKVYIVGADYNFGQISGQWAREYTEQAGGEVVGESYIPLESSDFNAVIDDLQRLQPDVVVSLLVGNNHVAFYRAYAAAGLNDEMRITSTVFGLSSEQNILTPEEARNVGVAYGYLPKLDSPGNMAFREAYAAEYGEEALNNMTDSAVTIWNGMHLWKAGVEKAGTAEREKVIEALESGVSFQGPSGAVTIEPGSHHVIQSVSIGETDGEGGFNVVSTEKDVQPAYEMSVCNLVEDPTINQQFTP